MGALGQGVALCGFATCIGTVILGVIYLAIAWPEDIALRWSDCSWVPESKHLKDVTRWANCNTANNYVQGQTSWSAFFSVIGILPAEPLIFGLFGSFMHRPCLLQVFGFPRNFLQYGMFMVLQALFGNFSYCGKLGVVMGYCSLAVACMSFVCQALGVKSDRMIRLSGSKRLKGQCSWAEEPLIESADEMDIEEEEDDEEEDDEDVEHGHGPRVGQLDAKLLINSQAPLRSQALESHNVPK